MLVDLESSLVAPVDLQVAEEVRVALHSRVVPAYTVSASPLEDAYLLSEESVVRAVLRQHKVKTKRLSTVLQTEGDDREEWCVRNRHLRQAKYWETYRKTAEGTHRENEKVLQRIEAFVSGLQAHAEAICVGQSDPASLQIYALASTAVGVARLQTYLETPSHRSSVGQLVHPRGGCGFLTGFTSYSGSNRAIYVQNVSTSFRQHSQFLAPHIVAGLEALVSRLWAYPGAVAELRDEAVAIRQYLWNPTPEDVLGDRPPETLS
jgi:hypothetical protein